MRPPQSPAFHAVLAMLIAMLIVSGAWLPAAAQGQEPVVESASLRLWPEYDDPGILVISAGSFSENLTYPLDVAFPIPENARSIQATVDDPKQGLMNRTWELKDGKLTYSLPLPGYHYEYYVDRPESGDERTVTYSFEAPYRTKALEVAVQQPARSIDFSVTPEPTGSFVGGDGFTYYTFTRENLAPGDRLDVTIRYNKTDESLSTVGAASAAAAPAPQADPAPEPGSSGVPDWLAWTLIIAGTVGVLGVVGYLLYQQRRATLVAPRRPTVPAAPRPSNPGPARTSGPAAGATFCTQCGRRLNSDDRFCSACGAPRRSQS